MLVSSAGRSLDSGSFSSAALSCACSSSRLRLKLSRLLATAFAAWMFCSIFARRVSQAAQRRLVAAEEQQQVQADDGQRDAREDPVARERRAVGRASRGTCCGVETVGDRHASLPIRLPAPAAGLAAGRRCRLLALGLGRLAGVLHVRVLRRHLEGGELQALGLLELASPAGRRARASASPRARRRSRPRSRRRCCCPRARALPPFAVILRSHTRCGIRVASSSRILTGPVRAASIWSMIASFCSISCCSSWNFLTSFWSLELLQLGLARGDQRALVRDARRHPHRDDQRRAPRRRRPRHRGTRPACAGSRHGAPRGRGAG